MRQYVASGTDLVTLVPNVIGQTQAARDTKSAASGRSRNRWSERELIDTVRTANPGEPGERMVRLYQFMRDRGARPSWGTGANASVTMWLGERDDNSSNPVSISIYADGVAINFDFVRDKRTPEQMQRFADLMRMIPGVAGYIQGLKRQNWGMHRGMKPDDVLHSDDALEAWKKTLDEASAPV